MADFVKISVAWNAHKVQKTKMGSREYLVAPMTLIVPGVLPGSLGPLYYPPEEIAKNVNDWNGMPLTLGHPLNGDSARDPETYKAQGLGHVYRARVRNGKLVAEGWFDVEAVNRIDKHLLTKLERGDRLELSTGLYTQNEPANNGANWKGRPYTHVARDYKPDHLAILPNAVGACSINDGCGVLNKGTPVKPVLPTVKPAFRQDNWERFQPMLEVAMEKRKVVNADLPSEEADLSPEKACKIIKDGGTHDRGGKWHDLTAAQRGMFGAACGQRKK